MRYLILFGLASISLLMGYLLRDRQWWLVDNMAGNLAAGFVGSLAVLFFIERSIENKRRVEQARLASLAFGRLRRSLQAIVNLFAEMLKASAREPISRLPGSLEELFSPTNTADMDWLDLDGATGHIERTFWRSEAEAILNAESDHLNSILDRYLPFLGAQLVEAIDSLISDPFFAYVRSCERVQRAQETIRAQGITLPRLSLNGSSEVREKFFSHLLEIVNQMERAGGKAPSVPTSLIRQDMMPKAGQARLKSLLPPVLFASGDPPVRSSVPTSD